MRSNIIAVNMTNEDGEAINAAFFTKDKVIRLYSRKAPSEKNGKSPHWKAMDLPISFWPQESAEARVGCVSTIQATLQNVIDGSDSTPWSIGGVYEIELKAKDHEDLDSETGKPSQPPQLFTRVREALATDPPRTVTAASLMAAATWLVEGPIHALSNGGMDKFTDPVLKTAKITVAPGSEDARLKPIVLDPKRMFYPKLTAYGYTQVELLQRCRKNGRTILLFGEPGCGKSSVFEAAFVDEYKAKGMVFLEDALIMGSESTRESDLTVDFKQLSDGTFEAVMMQVIKCALAGVPVLIDEALLIDPRVLSIVYSLIDGRGVLKVPGSAGIAGNTVYAAEGFYMGFAGNRNAPGAVLSEALKSRAIVRVEYTSDFDLAAKLAGPEHAEFITVARSLETLRQNGDVGTAFQFRDVMAYAVLSHEDELGGPGALANALTLFESDQDREQAADLIQRIMGVGNIPPFRI